MIRRAIGLGRGDAGDRRDQIGHDDGAGEGAGGEGQNGLQHRAVAQMHMPVIAAAAESKLSPVMRP